VSELLQVSGPLQKRPSSQTEAVGPVQLAPGMQPVMVHTSPMGHIEESKSDSQASEVSLQLSTEQATPSLHITVVPASQPTPTVQLSVPLQKAPSSQRESTPTLRQASMVASQLSSVHVSPSSQLGGVPGRQSSVGEQSSAPLQKVPSSHIPSSMTFRHPPPISEHESSVQATPSSQVGAVPAMQLKTGSQISGPSQMTPLSQRASSGVLTQPDVGLQVSTVHGRASAQDMGVPGAQSPETQVSVPVQGFMSSQSPSTAQLLPASQPVGAVPDAPVQTKPAPHMG